MGKERHLKSVPAGGFPKHTKKIIVKSGGAIVNTAMTDCNCQLGSDHESEVNAPR